MDLFVTHGRYCSTWTPQGWNCHTGGLAVGRDGVKKGMMRENNPVKKKTVVRE